MPTAAKVISALIFIALAWVVSDMVMQAMLEEDPHYNFGKFKLINLVVAALVGWRVLGRRVGNSYSVAIGLGLTALGAAVFWCLFMHATIEALALSMDRRFDGPMEAIIGAVELGVEYALELAHVNIIGVLLAGSIVGGLMAEFVSRRWS
ncbi:TrgA family protein [Lentibacter algarum]|uniref:TrgA family protein n=1 Tax=Lentibacter algarum TaxID=576131 RepID=UPI001C07BD16|nr:TrgA family protein [Lentibacter algarum]MBU2982258.1 TrgA family protein [Lentibacter algarum]